MSYKYNKIDLTWRDLSCSVENSKTKDGGVVQILKGVSGYSKAGQVTSIMGPSGAGKTTLMDILAGKTQRNKDMTLEGELLVNGEPIDYPRFFHSIGYVTQDDHMMPTETVRECFMFSAQLRLPSTVSALEKKKRVDAVIEELGLQDCENTYVGSAQHGIKGVSGGQKRRTSVGVELITSPTMLFLDEPTSGLDSEIAVSIMRTLKSIAANGRTVTLTIHQPNSDITELFDEFILMASGNIIYGGPWKDSVQAFADVGFPCPQFKNPTDYFMRIASDKDNVPSLVAAQARRALPPGTLEEVAIDKEGTISTKDLEVKEESPTSMLTQLGALCMRNVRAWQRHPIMLLGEGFQYAFLGLFIGGMYFGVSDDAIKGVFDRGSASFFLLVCIAFIPPFTVITVWQNERSLVRREVDQNVYGLGTFFTAKTLILLPVETFFATAVAAICYFMFGFQADAAKFFIFLALVLLALFIAESMGMLFAMVTPNSELAIVLASIVFILLLSLTGFLTEAPVYYEWIQYISFLRYANAGMFISEMKGLELNGEGGVKIPGDDLIAGHPLNNDLSIAENFGILIGMLVFIRAAAYVGLIFAYRKRWL